MRMNRGVEEVSMERINRIKGGFNNLSLLVRSTVAVVEHGPELAPEPASPSLHHRTSPS